MIIGNASDLSLNQNPGVLPDMSGTIVGWFQSLTFTTIVKSLVNYVVVETLTNIDFQGVWQPLNPQALNMKPEGQRSWSWFQCHSSRDLGLKTDEKITYLGIAYRIMARLDYSAYGYFEYHLVLDYEVP